MSNDRVYKEWTVLIYAAGNNNLESYIYQQFQTITKTVRDTRANLIIQISRPMIEVQDSDDEKLWGGTRRYKIVNHDAILIEDMGQVNMANPTVLRDFLIWGSCTFPSDNTTLIMSGHSAGFVGLMKAYSETGTSFMGIHGFAKALHGYYQKTKKAIHTLVMDTCFMNTVEIWYQICMIAPHIIKYVIMPNDNAPIQGLPWHEMMIVNNCNSYSHILYRMELEETGTSALLCIQLHRPYFTMLKRLIDDISRIILELDTPSRDKITEDCLIKQKYDYMSIHQLAYIVSQQGSEALSIYRMMMVVLDKIQLYPSVNQLDDGRNRGLRIFFPHHARVYLKFNRLYSQMAFNQHNSWVKTLDTINTKDSKSII